MNEEQNNQSLLTSAATVADGHGCTATSPLFQCERCLRYFAPGVSGSGLVVVSAAARPTGWFPDPFVCGLPDCSEIFEERSKAEAEAVGRLQAGCARSRREIREKRLLKREAKAKRGTRSAERGVAGNGAHGVTRPTTDAFRSPCPPERDFEGSTESRPTVVGSSEKEFHAAVETAGPDRKILNYLEAHYGVWVPMVTLELLSNQKRMNSRISEVRKLLPTDHDIDHRSFFYEPTGRVHSHYRLCLKSESERLKVPKDENQREF